MATGRTVQIGGVEIGAALPLALIAGPCVIESRDICLVIADGIREVCESLQLPCVFKASFDKANRSSIQSFRGPGLDEGLRILEEVREQTGLPILSDVHLPDQCQSAADVLDALQIPAFLARQTDLVVAAARTGKPVNVKKAQFMAPEDMANICEKARSVGNERILLTERGTAFGYHRLINDMRAIPAMQALGCPVVFDATHSVQAPGAAGTHSGGDRTMVRPLSLAAVAVGADALFLEVHPQPETALSDAATMLPLNELDAVLKPAAAIRTIVAG